MREYFTYFTRLGAVTWLLFTLVSCHTLNQKEFISWIQSPDNGFRILKEVNSFQLDIQYKPDLYVELERGTITQASTQPSDSMKVFQFALKMAGNNGADVVRGNANSNQEFQQNLYYYSYLFQSDIYLEGNGRKFPCVLYHFEKAIDSKGNRTMHLMFDAPAELANHQFSIVIESDRLSSLPIRFNFKNTSLPQVAGL
jgi:hypothetical protein